MTKRKVKTSIVKMSADEWNCFIRYTVLDFTVCVCAAFDKSTHILPRNRCEWNDVKSFWEKGYNDHSFFKRSLFFHFGGFLYFEVCVKSLNFRTGCIWTIIGEFYKMFNISEISDRRRILFWFQKCLFFSHHYFQPRVTVFVRPNLWPSGWKLQIWNVEIEMLKLKWKFKKKLCKSTDFWNQRHKLLRRLVYDSPLLLVQTLHNNRRSRSFCLGFQVFKSHLCLCFTESNYFHFKRDLKTFLFYLQKWKFLSDRFA